MTDTIGIALHRLDARHPPRTQEKRSTEMHSRSSLYEIHGISAREDARFRPQWGKGSFALLRRVISVLSGELAARRAARELSQLDDRMLRDIGISRSDIQRMVRQPYYARK